jgi:hypothetical protein
MMRPVVKPIFASLSNSFLLELLRSFEWKDTLRVIGGSMLREL